MTISSSLLKVKDKVENKYCAWDKPQLGCKLVTGNAVARSYRSRKSWATSQDKQLILSRYQQSLDLVQIWHQKMAPGRVHGGGGWLSVIRASPSRSSWFPRTHFRHHTTFQTSSQTSPQFHNSALIVYSSLLIWYIFELRDKLSRRKIARRQSHSKHIKLTTLSSTGCRRIWVTGSAVGCEVRKYTSTQERSSALEDSRSVSRGIHATALIQFSNHPWKYFIPGERSQRLWVARLTSLVCNNSGGWESGSQYSKYREAA